MIVCICKAVSERHIRAAVTDGTTRLKDISRRTGLGTCCGKCLPDAKLAIESCIAARESRAACFAPAAEAAA